MNPDQSRQAATTADSEYTLSIDEAAARYEHAGHPRTTRSIQRYCAKGHLDCRRIETPFGEKFLIEPNSVAKHIAYIEEVRPAATVRDMSRQDAAGRDIEDRHERPGHETKTDPNKSRHVATTAEPIRYVAALERENDFLRGQVVVKDTQIADLLERGKETNTLIHRLQTMLAPLLSASGDRRSEPRQEDTGRS